MKNCAARLWAAFQLFASLVCAHAFAAPVPVPVPVPAPVPVPSADVPLDVPAAFTATSIAAVGNGLYCIAGFVYHDEVPNASALAVLVDTNARRVVWKTDIPFARDHYENTATDCLHEGDAYYVLTEEHTDSRPDRNQTQLVLSKLSEDEGTLLATHRVDVGFNVWANRFQAAAQGVSIVGGTSSDSLSRDGKRSLFFAQFDHELSRKQLIVLPTGAFWSASAKLDGKSLLVAGEFLPNAGAASTREGCAVSKVDLGKARYVWSSFVYPLNIDAQRAIFLPDGGAAYVGVNKNHLLISMLDGAGHVARRLTTAQKPICTIDALAMKGTALQVVGSSCADQHATLLLDVDSATGQIASSRPIGNDIAAVLFDGDSIALVSGKSWTDRKALSRVAR